MDMLNLRCIRTLLTSFADEFMKVSAIESLNDLIILLYLNTILFHAMHDSLNAVLPHKPF